MHGVEQSSEQPVDASGLERPLPLERETMPHGISWMRIKQHQKEHENIFELLLKAHICNLVAAGRNKDELALHAVCVHACQMNKQMNLVPGLSF